MLEKCLINDTILSKRDLSNIILRSYDVGLELSHSRKREENDVS